MQSKFGQCAVVFDGYEAGSSTTDHEHCRRSVKNRGTVELMFKEETEVKEALKRHSFQMKRAKEDLKRCFQNI